MLAGPARDPLFAISPLHGALVQKFTIYSAIKLCKKRRTAVDAGAHIGIWSDAMLNAGFLRVMSFEPVEENRSCLEQNVPRAIVLPLALGADYGTCDMVMPDKGNSGMWRASVGATTQVAPLDAYELESVDLIKIDTEGKEGDVLLGALRTIQRSSPVIVLEHNGLGQKYYGPNWIDPLKILQELGYRLVRKVRKDYIFRC